MKCALYRITHRFTGRVYVGISVNPGKRWKQHRQSKDGSIFHTDIKMLGPEAFTWNIECWFNSVEEAVAEEVEQITLLLKTPELAYNNYLLGKGVSAESAKKISEALQGHGVSEITRQKMRASAKIRKRQPHSQSTKDKIGKANSIALKGHAIPQHVRDKISARVSKTLTGHVVTNETRNKLRVAGKLQGQMRRLKKAILAWEMANDPIRIDLNE